MGAQLGYGRLEVIRMDDDILEALIMIQEQHNTVQKQLLRTLNVIDVLQMQIQQLELEVMKLKGDKK